MIAISRPIIIIIIIIACLSPPHVFLGVAFVWVVLINVLFLAWDVASYALG